MDDVDPWPKFAIWKYAVIPFMSGAVGWFTNWLALEMTFKPIEYRGYDYFRVKDQPWGLFGWQGIVPTNAEKMARTTVRLMTTKLFKLEDIFKKLDPGKFYEAAEDALLLLIDEIVSETASHHMPSAWYYIPQAVKNEIILSANRACPQFLSGFVADMQINIDSILDLEHMCVSVCLENKEKVNRIFLECGENEFIFIKRSGFYFGFLFGCIQAGIWLVYPAGWMLPFCGFVVGWFTNYLALKIIFRPVDPVNLCGKTIQGLFLKRQDEVSATFAHINCSELLNTETMWEHILKGPNRAKFQALLRAHTIVFTEKLIGGLRPFALAAMGNQGFADMKEDVAEKVIEKIDTIIPHTYRYTEEAMDLEATIRESMQNLSSKEFEAVLHPAFEEDEMSLVFTGGVLGMLVGIIQIFAVF